jgi:hypothetical protein
MLPPWVDDMGTYTIHEDPEVDEQIESKIQAIVAKLTKAFPEIYSVILTGGFGKGEGSITITDSIVKPLRDFDFIVVFEKHVPKRQFERFVANLHLSKELESIYEYKYARDFALDIHATTVKNPNSYPDVVTFDLKESRVVYGKDIRSSIMIESNKIPLRSGARMLFQKSTALVGVMSSDVMKKGFETTEAKDNFIRETTKAYVEISSALCMLAYRYDAHARKRLQILRDIYTERFQEFSKDHPSLIERIETSTNYKLDPHSNPITINPVKLWFQTRDDLGEVAKLYFKEYLGLDFKEWASYIQSVEKILRKTYYIPLIDNLLSIKGIPRNRCLVNSMNALYNLKENLDLAKKSDKYNARVLLSRTSASIRFLCACFLLLFALNPDGTIIDEYVQKVDKNLGFVKLNKDPASTWDRARLKCLVLMNSLNLL